MVKSDQIRVFNMLSATNSKKDILPKYKLAAIKNIDLGENYTASL